MTSFEKIDFSLRPNKNVERKLLVRIVRELLSEFPISDYRYIGMGSMWFVDFRLVHRELGIKDMVSIERDSADRARFNKPFECVKVVEGEATQVLPKLGLEKSQAIVWLDHQDGIDGDAIDDISYVAEKVPSGSAIFVTVNAHPGQLKGQQDPEGVDMSPEEALRFFQPKFAPDVLEPDALNNKGFDTTVVSVVTSAIQHSLLTSGRTERFYRLAAFSYSDNATMVTVGGMVASVEDAAKLEAVAPWARLDFVSREGEALHKIEVPPLTRREKTALDQLLPCDDLSPQVVEEALGFTLKTDPLASYRRFYKEYPVYGEIML